MNSNRSVFTSTLLAANRTAPWLALVMAGLAVVAAPQPSATDGATTERHARIERVFSSVPLRVGEWIGEERPLAPAAVELLRPNAALSRSFRRIGDPSTIVLSLIHCSDFRDMAGHYPPVCYPAHGWSLADPIDVASEPVAGTDSSARLESTSLSIEGLGEFPVRCYRFSRRGDGLAQIRMTVLNAFILPDGRWVSDLATIREGASRRRLAGEGVAQLQLVVGGWPSIESIREQCQSLLSSFPSGVFETLGAARLERSAELEPADE